MRIRSCLITALLVGASTVLTMPPALAAGEADLSVRVEAPPTAYVGEFVTLSAFLVNHGPSSADAAVLTVTLAGPATLFGAPGCQSEGSTRLVCQIGTMSANGALPPQQFQARVNAAGAVTFTAEISSPTPDPNTANNTATDTVVVVAGGPADLSARASINHPAPLRVGEETNYAVNFGNNGPSDATSVTLNSTVSANLEIFGFSYPGCTATATTIHCEFPTWQAQTLGILLVRIRAVAPGAATITAGIASADNPDPDPSNNASAVTVQVDASADLGVSLTESSDPVKSKRDLVLTATITNTGPSAATMTTLAEDLGYDGPQGFTIVLVTPSQGSCVTSGAAVSCDLGTVAAGGTATVAVTVQARGTGTLTTQAQVHAAESDPVSANNAAIESTRVTTSGH
jgi:uncharacterized repeat protein (TIGR01451 family)